MFHVNLQGCILMTLLCQPTFPRLFVLSLLESFVQRTASGSVGTSCRSKRDVFETLGTDDENVFRGWMVG